MPSFPSSRTTPSALMASRILSDNAHIFCFLISFRTSTIKSINPASTDAPPEATDDGSFVGSPRIPEPNSSKNLSISRSGTLGRRHPRHQPLIHFRYEIKHDGNCFGCVEVVIHRADKFIPGTVSSLFRSARMKMNASQNRWLHAIFSLYSAILQDLSSTRPTLAH